MIEHALTIASIVLFLHSCTWGGMIFNGIQNWVKPEDWMSKPIYNCPICMTPYYGTLIYVLFFGVSLQDWLLTVGTACGFSVVSVVLITIREYFLNQE